MQYNALWSIESQLTFCRNMTPPFKDTPSKKPAWRRWQEERSACESLGLCKKWECSARQFVSSHWHAHRTVTQQECHTTYQFPPALTQNRVNQQETREKQQVLTLRKAGISYLETWGTHIMRVWCIEKEESWRVLLTVFQACFN